VVVAWLEALMTSRHCEQENAVTIDDFRKIALSLPEATETAQMGQPDIRVRRQSGHRETEDREAMRDIEMACKSWGAGSSTLLREIAEPRDSTDFKSPY
jgi:hypothetical protein